MFTVEMAKQCRCFQRSDFDAIQTFTTKKEALEKAETMCEEMNETFCQKHNFSFVESKNVILIQMEES